MRRVLVFVIFFAFGPVARPAAGETRLFEGNTIELSAAETGATPDSVVMIDGAVATGFTQWHSDGVLIVRVPFPEAADAVRLTILTGIDGAKLFEARFRRAGAFDLFEQYSSSFQGQVDSFVTQRAEPMPDPGAGFDLTDMQADGRLGYTLSGVRGPISASLEGEFTGTSNGAATLRDDGSAIDLSRNEFKLALASQSALAELRLGDTSVAGGNELVSNGLRSRGLSARLSLLDARIRIEAGRVYGTDIVGLTKGVVPGGDDNVRFGVNIAADVLRNGPLSLTLGADWLDVRRPVGFNFNIAEIPDAETNRVLGFSMEASALSGKLNYRGRWARSVYDNPANPINAGFLGNGLSTGASHDEAWSHAADWSVWSGPILGQPGNIQLQLRRARTGLVFRSVAGSAAADREDSSVSLAFSRSALSGNLAFLSTENNVDNVPGILKTGTETWQGDLSIATDLLWAGKDGQGTRPAWAPQSINFGTRQESIRTLNADTVQQFSSLNGSELPRQVSETLQVGASWAWGQKHPQSISLNWSLSQLDNRQLGRELADNEDARWDVSYSLGGGWWNAGLRVGRSENDTLDPTAASQNIGWDYGATLDMRPADLPGVSLSYDQSRARREDFTFLSRSADDSKRYGVSMDLTGWLDSKWPALGGDLVPAISLNWQRSEGRNRSDFFNQDSRDESFTINIGSSF